MTVKDRIMEFCRMSGIKPGRFERECGLSNAYLSKLKHEPSRDKLGKIFARYPELNKDWLLNGEGPMLNVVHYPAMEGGNELLVNDQAYYVGRPAGSDEVLIPRDAWEVIKKQADSFKERDEQMNRVFLYWRSRWIKENKADCFWNFQGCAWSAISARQEVSSVCVIASAACYR